MASVLRLIGFQGQGRKGERLVGAPNKKDQTEFTWKYVPFTMDFPGTWSKLCLMPELKWRGDGLANVFILLYSMSRVSVLVKCAGNHWTVTFLAQHKPQQGALVWKNIKDGRGDGPFIFCFWFPVQQQTLTGVMFLKKCLVFFSLFCELAVHYLSKWLKFFNWFWPI